MDPLPEDEAKKWSERLTSLQTAVLTTCAVDPEDVDNAGRTRFVTRLRNHATALKLAAEQWEVDLLKREGGLLGATRAYNVNVDEMREDVMQEARDHVSDEMKKVNGETKKAKDAKLENEQQRQLNEKERAAIEVKQERLLKWEEDSKYNLAGREEDLTEQYEDQVKALQEKYVERKELQDQRDKLLDDRSEQLNTRETLLDKKEGELDEKEKKVDRDCRLASQNFLMAKKRNEEATAKQDFVARLWPDDDEELPSKCLKLEKEVQVLRDLLNHAGVATPRNIEVSEQAKKRRFDQTGASSSAGHGGSDDVFARNALTTEAEATQADATHAMELDSSTERQEDGVDAGVGASGLGITVTPAGSASGGGLVAARSDIFTFGGGPAPAGRGLGELTIRGAGTPPAAQGNGSPMARGSGTQSSAGPSGESRRGGRGGGTAGVSKQPGRRSVRSSVAEVTKISDAQASFKKQYAHKPAKKATDPLTNTIEELFTRYNVQYFWDGVCKPAVDLLSHNRVKERLELTLQFFLTEEGYEALAVTTKGGTKCAVQRHFKTLVLTPVNETVACDYGVSEGTACIHLAGKVATLVPREGAVLEFDPYTWGSASFDEK
ncbi:hypothetical protein LTR17_013187 [Elasticomyces elasticus]|nr:hypothetical protein LTR17_013187 [Elasticomyces elasticus]